MTNNFAVHALRDGAKVNAAVSSHLSHMSVTIVAGGELVAIIVTEDLEYARRLSDTINRAAETPAMPDDRQRAMAKAA